MASVPQMIEALRNADAAGDADAAARIAQMIQKERQKTTAAEPVSLPELGVQTLPPGPLLTPTIIEAIESGERLPVAPDEQPGILEQFLTKGLGPATRIAARTPAGIADVLAAPGILAKNVLSEGEPTELFGITKKVDEFLENLGIPDLPPEVKGTLAGNILEIVGGLGPGAAIAKGVAKALPQVGAGIAPKAGRFFQTQARITAPEVVAATGAGAGLTAGQALTEGASSEAQTLGSILGAVTGGLTPGLAAKLPGLPGATLGGAANIAGRGKVQDVAVGVDVIDEFKRTLGLPDDIADADVVNLVQQRVAQKTDELTSAGLSEAEIGDILTVQSVFPELEGSALARTLEGADPSAARQKFRGQEIAAAARAEGLPEGELAPAREFFAGELGAERAGVQQAVTETGEAAVAAEQALAAQRGLADVEAAGERIIEGVREGQRPFRAETSAAFQAIPGAAQGRAFDVSSLQSDIKTLRGEIEPFDVPGAKRAIDQFAKLDEFSSIEDVTNLRAVLNDALSKQGISPTEKKFIRDAKATVDSFIGDAAEGTVVSRDLAGDVSVPGEQVKLPKLAETIAEATGKKKVEAKIFEGRGADVTKKTVAGGIVEGRIKAVNVADRIVSTPGSAKNFVASLSKSDNFAKQQTGDALKDSLTNKFLDETGGFKDGVSGRKNFIKWYKQNREALKILGPDFNARFKTPADAIEALQKAQVTENVYNSSTRARILSEVLDSPDKGWVNLQHVAGDDIVKVARKALIDAKRSDNPKLVTKSLQASYGEYLGQKFSDPDQFIKLLEGTQPAMKRERRVMEVMMSKKQINALRKAAIVAKEAENIKVKITEDPGKAAVEEILSLGKSVIGNVWLATFGATLLSPKSAAVRQSLRFVRGKRRILETKGQKQILARAFSDPEYLVNLLEKTSPKKVEKQRKIFLWLARDRSEDENEQK